LHGRSLRHHGARQNAEGPAGGQLELTWHTSADDLPGWRDIDQQVWRFVAAWNIAAPE
jgi:hypothetical protein